MTAFSIYPSEPDYGMLLPPDTLTLSDADVDWARAQSQTISDPAQRWQTYLNALARIGLQQWLEKRSPELLEDTNRFLRISADQLCEVRLRHYRLYLVATDRVGDSEVAFPNLATTTAFHPHFYVLVEVFEELQQVRVCGYLDQSQIAQLLQSQVGAAPAEEITWLPMTAFELNADRLLLHLNCLEPEAVAATAPTTTLLDTARNAAINAALWINNQLDQFAQELSWVLLPPSSAPAMRPLRDFAVELDDIMTDLMNRERIELPPQVGYAYQDIELSSQVVRLYAVTWAVDSSGWRLLLILGTPDGSRLNPTTRLRVRDEIQQLADSGLEREQDDYIYVQVAGVQNEKFYITLQQNNEQVTLSPMTFNTEPN